MPHDGDRTSARPNNLVQFAQASVIQETTLLPHVETLHRVLTRFKNTCLDFPVAASSNLAEPLDVHIFHVNRLGSWTGLVGLGFIAADSGEAAASLRDSWNDRESFRDWRSNRRADRRLGLDERWRRSAGGERGGTHSDYDWAGGAILERYLDGGGDWVIDNDPNWREYMQGNETLSNDLQSRALDTAQKIFMSGSDSLAIDEQYPMEIENGEGIVGYQYLHGTNANVGDFQRQGGAQMKPDGKGGYTVTLTMRYTWNDVIDPNPQYATDQWKSKIAEIITLGQAEAYDMHIAWEETTVVHLDANGTPTAIENK